MTKNELFIKIHNQLEYLVMYKGINHLDNELNELWNKYHSLSDSDSLNELKQLNSDIKKVIIADKKITEAYLLIKQLKTI